MSAKQHPTFACSMLLLGVLLVSASIVNAKPTDQVTSAAQTSAPRKLLGAAAAAQECVPCPSVKPLYATACKAAWIQVGTIGLTGQSRLTSNIRWEQADVNKEKRLLYSDGKPVEISPGVTLAIWRIPPYRGWQVMNITPEKGACDGDCNTCCGDTARYTARFYC